MTIRPMHLCMLALLSVFSTTAVAQTATTPAPVTPPAGTTPTTPKATTTTPKTSDDPATDDKKDDATSSTTTTPSTTVPPVDNVPVDGAPVDAVPVDGAPVDGAPVDGAPVDVVPGDIPVDAPVPDENAPVDDSTTTVTPEPGDPSFGKLPPTGNDDPMAPRLNGDIPNLQQSDGIMGNFMDTRLSFSLSDDNWLAGPGQSTPSSPRLDFFPRTNNQLFFDNLNRRDSGFETLTHMVLHRRQKGFIPGMDTEAAIVARFIYFADDVTGRRGSVFRDDGSYIRVRYFFSGSTEDEKASNIDLVMFPFDTNRFRLGYLYDISWGGHDIFPAQGVAAPGAKMQLNILDGYAYLGAKTARLLDENINEVEANWGVLSGAGYDFFDMFQFDVGGGFFQRGTNPLVGVEGEPVYGAGVSSRAVLHLGEASPSAIDFRLYRADPALADLFKIARKGRTGFAFLAALEVSHLEQTLQDPENPNTTKLQAWGPNTLLGGANAAAMSMRVSYGDFSIGADGVYRDLAFILFNGPSFVPFQDFPKDAVLTPEYLFALSSSYFIEALHLTPGIVLGVQMPATFTGLSPGTIGSDPNVVHDLSASQVVVVRNIGSRDILPCAEFDDPLSPTRQCVTAQQAEPIYAARLALKWDVSEIVAIVAETTFFLDNNETDLIDNEGGIITRARVSRVNFLTIPGSNIGLFPGTTGPHNVRLAGGLFAQARF